MKKLLSILFIAFSCFCIQAQEGIVFKVIIKPNTTYTSEMNTYTLTETLLTTGEALPDSKDNKSTMESTLKVTSIMKSQGKREDGNIPITIRYEDATSAMLINGNEQAMDLPITDLAIQASYTPENRIMLDTIVGESFNPQFKQLIGNMLDQMVQPVEFPDSAIQVGDQFTTEQPLTIPNPGMSPIQMKIKSTYTLNQIKEGKAFLSFQQDVTLESTQEGFSMDAKGSGTGVCEYHIDGQYLSYYKTDLPWQMTINLNENMSSIVSSTTISEIKMTAE